MAGLSKDQIRIGNDLLRDTFFKIFGIVSITDGVKHSPVKEQIITMVREFKDFSNSNDPHGEHDFGSFEVENPEGEFCEERMKSYTKASFKIDYYAPDLIYGADPYSEPFKRVLTIMLANEY